MTNPDSATADAAVPAQLAELQQAIADLTPLVDALTTAAHSYLDYANHEHRMVRSKRIALGKIAEPIPTMPDLAPLGDEDLVPPQLLFRDKQVATAQAATKFYILVTDVGVRRAAAMELSSRARQAAAPGDPTYQHALDELMGLAKQADLAVDSVDDAAAPHDTVHERQLYAATYAEIRDVRNKNVGAIGRVLKRLATHEALSGLENKLGAHAFGDATAVDELAIEADRLKEMSVVVPSRRPREASTREAELDAHRSEVRRILGSWDGHREQLQSSRAARKRLVQTAEVWISDAEPLTTHPGSLTRHAEIAAQVKKVASAAALDEPAMLRTPPPAIPVLRHREAYISEYLGPLTTPGNSAKVA